MRWRDDSIPLVSGTGSATLAYRYATASTLTRDQLSLATSGGITEAGPAAHPYFFTGFLAEPGPAAQALLATAAIARARYHVAASVIAALVRDPVVTSNADRLRFESFSACCGVPAADQPGASPRQPDVRGVPRGCPAR